MLPTFCGCWHSTCRSDSNLLPVPASKGRHSAAGLCLYNISLFLTCCNLSTGLQMLTAYAVANVLNPNKWEGIFHDANDSMLTLFLVANLLTGGINLSIDTLAVGDWAALGIVCLYTVMLCGLACALQFGKSFYDYEMHLRLQRVQKSNK